jgi:uncharacterized protein (DUF2336 family)
MMHIARDIAEEIDGRVLSRSGADRQRLLMRVMDLLELHAALLPETHLAVFDAVLLRLAADVETAARVALSERLSVLERAPPEAVRILAHDLPPVAQPVIARAARLSTHDLVSVAESRGQRHMHLIAERPNISPKVTDVLVTRGDKTVLSAVAGNASARFSHDGMARMIEIAATDRRLLDVIGRRGDIAQAELAARVGAARERVAAERRRLAMVSPERIDDALARGVDHLVDLFAADAVQGDGEDEAMVEQLISRGALDEAKIFEFAVRRRRRALVLSLMHIAALDAADAEDLMGAGDPDALAFLLRANGFGWRTARCVILARRAPALAHDALLRLRENFHATHPDVARRIFSYRRAM